MIIDEIKFSFEEKIKEIIDKVQKQEILSDEEIKICIAKQFFCQYKLPDRLESKVPLVFREPENFKIDEINFVELPKEDISKILILDFHLIGDTTYLVPFINALQENYKTAKISCLSWDNHLEVIHTHSNLKTTYHFKARDYINAYLESENGHSKLEDFVKHISEILEYVQNENFDLVINLQPSRLSCLTSFMTKAKFKSGWSLTEQNKIFFNGNFWAYLSIHADVLHRAEQLIRILNIVPEKFNSIVKKGSNSENTLVAEILPKDKNFFGLVPAARFVIRCWDAFRFAQLADRLSVKFDLQSLIFCKNDEMAIANFIESKQNVKPVNLCGKTSLFNIRDFVEKCEFVVTNDTGPKHIAVTAGIPVIEIRGPGEKLKNCGPFGPNNIILEANLPCVGCNTVSCESRSCLDLISVDAVYQAVSLLQKIKEANEINWEKIKILVSEMIDKSVFKEINLFYSGWDLPKKDFSYYLLQGEFNSKKELKNVIDYCTIKTWESKNDYLLGGALSLSSVSKENLLRSMFINQENSKIVVELLDNFLNLAEEFKKEFKNKFEDENVVKDDRFRNYILEKTPSEMKNIITINFGLSDLIGNTDDVSKDKFTRYALLDTELFCIYFKKALKILKENYEV